jgi:hypothetical protein
MILTQVPTSDQYEAEVSRLGLNIKNAREKYDSRARSLDRSASTCPGIRGWRVPGRLTECDAWKADGVKLWNQERISLSAAISAANKQLEDYQNAVISIRDLENKRKIEEHLAEQAQLIEDRIAETFRVQAEEFMRATQANTVSNVETDQTLVQTVSTSKDKGFVETQTLQSPQGLQGSFFPIMMLGVMLG